MASSRAWFRRPNGPQPILKARKPCALTARRCSASASEMLARYLQLTHRGKIIGDRTSGSVNAARIFRGVIGSVYGVYYAVEIAVARAVMVDGDALEGKGVLPDELCFPTGDDLRSGRDPCLNKALELARGSPPKEMSSSSTGPACGALGRGQWGVAKRRQVIIPPPSLTLPSTLPRIASREQCDRNLSLCI